MADDVTIKFTADVSGLQQGMQEATSAVEATTRALRRRSIGPSTRALAMLPGGVSGAEGCGRVGPSFLLERTLSASSRRRSAGHAAINCGNTCSSSSVRCAVTDATSAVVTFVLAGDAAGFMTGKMLEVDGGIETPNLPLGLPDL